MASTSKSQDSVTLKVKGDHLDTTESAIETPKTTDPLATHEATSLEVDAQHKDSDTYAFNTPTETILAVTQGLATLEITATHPNESISSINTPPKTDLPVDVWMCVFDHIPTDDDYARPKSIAAYASSLHTDGDSIEAAKTLPEFEKRSWSKTRPLYAINRNSRGAALKLQLCMHVLRTSKKPLVPSEWRRTFRRFLIQPFPSFQIIAPVVPAPAHQYIAVALSAQGMSGPE
jgi:hypothetical protein